MPFVVMAVLAVGVTVWLFGIRPRRVLAGHGEQASGIDAVPGRRAGDVPMRSDLVGVRGWLLVYVIGLGVQALHDLGLTVAALVISARPSLAGLDSFAPLPLVLFYVVGNLILVVYVVALYGLMLRRRRSAVAHNVICNAVAIVFLVCWHLLGMKSSAGAVIDSLPSVVGAWYILASRRVRNTFVAYGKG